MEKEEIYRNYPKVKPVVLKYSRNVLHKAES